MPAQLSLPQLPISEILPAVQRCLQEHDELILEAPPGAGKTTLLPLSLLQQDWLGEGRILMLEPRRMAARAAAHRMAQLLDEKPGETVGYRVRQESRVGRNTRIEVITEGILNRMLLDDPALSAVSAVIFDEFHERSLDADTGLALTLQGRSLFRDAGNPLKVVVMSATLNGAALAALLPTAPVLRSEGKRFPVTLHYGEAHRFDDNIVARTSRTLLQVLHQHQGNVLVFLPGRAEIERLAQQLNSQLDERTRVFPLYGGLSPQHQQQAIEPAAKGTRKIVLATDIAESSLTIEGITVVIDSGLRRQPAFDPNTGMTRLHTRRISQDSSEQRAGRAGRLSAGHCYRLWSEQQQQQLAAHREPEILQADLAPLLLQLLAWGVDDMTTLDWLDLPPQGATHQALDLLQQLEAITLQQSATTAQAAANPYQLNQWRLSPVGQQLSTLPTHPRLAHMLVTSTRYQLQQQACTLAAVLTENNPIPNDSGANLGTVLSGLDASADRNPWAQRVRRQAQHFLSLLQKLPAPATETPISTDANGFLLASAYPDRIARRRQKTPPSYQLSNGQFATLLPEDSLAGHEWLAVAQAGGKHSAGRPAGELRIFAALPLNADLFGAELKYLCRSREVIDWDEQADRFIAEQHSLIGKLLIDKIRIDNVTPQQKTDALLGFIRRHGLDILPWDDVTRQWQARVLLLRKLEPACDSSGSWPDVSDKALMDNLESWLAPHLQSIQRLSDFRKLDLMSILNLFLSWPRQQQLAHKAPIRIEVPSGLTHPIDYLSEPPVLRVKLQEMFGSQQTPSIIDGRVDLLIHLLSPAGRPLQITQDLAAFWSNGYRDVKKEMKGRYPKHPWPDDPTTAQATRSTKHRAR